MRLNKVKPIEKVAKLVKSAKEEGKNVSLVTGCFDILHIGHIKMFRYAKKISDIVVVGLENPDNIRISKGEGRPIHKFNERAEALSEFVSVDLIFKVKEIVDFGSRDADKIYQSIYERVKPNFIITSQHFDKFWNNKKRNAKEIGAKLVLYRENRPISSTKIVEQLQREF